MFLCTSFGGDENHGLVSIQCFHNIFGHPWYKGLLLSLLPLICIIWRNWSLLIEMARSPHVIKTSIE